MTKLKWYNEIVAWAGGAEIECIDEDGKWGVINNPGWYDFGEYRIKPQPVEPQYLYVYFGNRSSDGYYHFVSTDHPTGMTEYEYIGKIPLIVESNDD